MTMIHKIDYVGLNAERRKWGVTRFVGLCTYIAVALSSGSLAAQISTAPLARDSIAQHQLTNRPNMTFLGSLAEQTSQAPPARYTIARHRFMDRTNITSMSFSAAAHAVDAAYTCHLLAVHGLKEEIAPFNSCGGISSWVALGSGAGVGSSYWLHRTNHHKLERWANWISAGGSAFGVGYSIAHRR
jgi:hypothetical protein